MIEEGDFIQIPLSDGRRALAWVLFISKNFKGTVGFVVFGVEGVRCVESTKAKSMRVLGPYYTHVANLNDYGCHVVDHAEIPESKRELTKRRVGGGVYVGDDYVGSVEELEAYDLKPMLFMGMDLITRDIEAAFP